MNEARVKDLIKVWYEKAKLENSPFSRFVFLWFCFNAWVAYRSNAETDTAMINWLVGRSPANSDLIGEYEHAMQTKPFQKLVGSLAQMSPIYDARDRRPPVAIRNETDREGVIRGIYRIRCNLFHGGKRADNVRDQGLVVLAQRILEKWLGNLIVSWRN